MKIKLADGTSKNVEPFFEKKATKGRPKKVLNEDGILVIENLASIMCTEEEIASILGASVDTLLNNDNKELFRTAIEKGKQGGKASLRREQWKLAQKGNASMLIWLGKQWLGQTDKVEQTTSFEDLTPLADLIRRKDK